MKKITKLFACLGFAVSAFVASISIAKGFKPLVLNAESSFIGGQVNTTGDQIGVFTASANFPLSLGSNKVSTLAYTGSIESGFSFIYDDTGSLPANYHSVLGFLVNPNGSNYSIKVTPFGRSGFSFAFNYNSVVGFEETTRIISPSNGIISVSSLKIYFPLTSDAYYNGYNEGYDRGYDKGYTTGVNEGDTTGYTRGLEEGFQTGKADGYQAGYSAGVQSSGSFPSQLGDLLFKIVVLPVDVIMRVLDFDILGVNLSSFTKSLITFVLILFVIRLIFNMPVKIDNGAKPTEPNQPHDHTTITTTQNRKGEITGQTTIERRYK